MSKSEAIYHNHKPSLQNWLDLTESVALSFTSGPEAISELIMMHMTKTFRNTLQDIY